jgi:hypothetical protein
VQVVVPSFKKHRASTADQGNEGQLDDSKGVTRKRKGKPTKDSTNAVDKIYKPQVKVPGLRRVARLEIAPKGEPCDTEARSLKHAVSLGLSMSLLLII